MSLDTLWCLHNVFGNRDRPHVEEKRSPFQLGTELRESEFHLGRDHPFWEFSTDLHYLGLSTDLKTVTCQFVVMVTLRNKLKITNFVS